MDATRYQLYAPLTDGNTINATSDVSDVKINVSPIVEGRATVKATYNGKTKIFLLN